MTELLDRDALLAAFQALDEELGHRGVRGELFVVGGAAMALAYDARRATRDVDAVFVPSTAVRAAADAVAERLDLPEGWLNDGAKGFIPGVDDRRGTAFEGEHLSVSVASPRFLLSMKLLAARPDRDQDDIRTLYRLCDFRYAEDGMDLVAHSYPARVIAPRVQFLLEEMFPSRSRTRGDDGLSR